MRRLLLILGLFLLFALPSFGVACAAPTITLAAGPYTGIQTTTITSACTNTPTVICYTTNGTTPVSSSASACSTGTVYSTAITINTSITLKAIARSSTKTDSTAASSAYTITVNTPTVDNDTGSYPNTITVTISDAFTSSTIKQCTDTTNTCTPTTTYSGPVVITVTGTYLRSIGTFSGATDSAVKSSLYTITTTSTHIFPISMLGVGWGQAAAVAIAQVGTVVGQAGVCNQVATCTSNTFTPVTGELLIVTPRHCTDVTCSSATGTPSTISGVSCNSVALTQAGTCANTNVARADIWYKANFTGASNITCVVSYTTSTNMYFGAMEITRWSGAATSNVLDAVGSCSQGTSATPSSSVTAAVTNELILGVVESLNTPTAVHASAGDGINDYRIPALSGALTNDWTQTSAWYAAISAAFKHQ